MTLFRFLLLALAIYWIWRLLRRPAVSPPTETPYLPMARCARCGAHVPEDTRSKDGRCARCAAAP